MKKSDLTFSALLVPIDYLMVVGAGLLAYYLRFSSSLTELREVFYELPFGEYFNILLLVGVAWLIIFAVSGLYSMSGTRRLIDELLKIFVACSTGVMFIIILIFFQRELFSSRFIILAGWIISIITVSLGRILVRTIQNVMYKRGVGLHNIVIIGNDKTSDDIIEQISRSPALGFRIIERISEYNNTTLPKLTERLRHQPIDEIMLADVDLPKEATIELIDFCEDHHITFKYAADLFDTQATNLDVHTIAGVPVIEVKRTPLDGWWRIIKRLVDIVLGTSLIIVLSPILLITAIFIKVDSKGPIIVKLERVGLHGKPFVLYKFRSMVEQAHAMKKELLQYNERKDGPLFKMNRDPRITRVGRFIRRTSIDELPQFFNVLQGKISLVGPRPHEPEEVAQYKKHHRKLLAIKPGVTGMAQISGRSDLSFEEEVRLDTFYIEHWKLRLDIQILLKTPWAVISPRRAV
ncbi:MAG: sugar transferase [Patescibacteria group bacterium]